MTVTTDNTPVYSGVRFSASKKREQTMNNEMMALICGLLMGIQALSVQKHFQKSHFGQASQIGEIDVDAYAICFNEDDLKEDRYNGLEFFIKLAIDPEEPLTAIVSFHLSGSP